MLITSVSASWSNEGIRTRKPKRTSKGVHKLALDHKFVMSRPARVVGERNALGRIMEISAPWPTNFLGESMGRHAICSRIRGKPEPRFIPVAMK
jgi:hypothetical protein